MPNARIFARSRGALGFVLPACLVIACQNAPEASALYFGQVLPGDTPSVFAPGIISKDDRFEQFLLYAPDGRELTFGTTNDDWSAFFLYHMQLEDGRWSEPLPAPFLGSDSSGLTSCLSFDTETAFFTAARPSWPPVDIWMSKRADSGWSEPTKLGPPVSSAAHEFEVAISRNGTLYFSSTREGGLGDIDIYRARPVEGRYPTVENLGPPINTSAGDDLPYIAPDESYLIFASDRPGGFGLRDLYVSFPVDGGWGEPINLGRPINSEVWDIYPSLSPDGKFLFFTRRESWEASEDSDIYWVSAAFLDRLRDSVQPAASSGPDGG